jgi:copper homeostasis protein
MSSQNNYLLEACTDSVTDALEAQKAGLHRIELCSALTEGGLTPSFSLMQLAVKRLTIPVHVMIRPRAGDFLYTDEEFSLMLQDIEHAKELGAAGVVFGVLKADGTFDTERMAALIARAHPMKIVVHRAFDMTVDPFLALEAIIGLGAHIVLTSGQRQTAEDGLDLIKELVKRANGRIQILAGGGVNRSNVKLLAVAGVRDFHFTVRKAVESPMKYRNEALGGMGAMAGNEFVRYVFDEEKVMGVKRELT